MNNTFGKGSKKEQDFVQVKMSQLRISNTSYRDQLFESKVTSELYSVNPVGHCLIILLNLLTF